MYKSLSITFLALLSFVSTPTVSLAQACVGLDGASVSHPSPDSQIAKSQQSREMAEIAVALFRAGQPNRAAQVNEQIRSRFKLEPKDLTTLVMIQYLMAGDQAAATAQLPKLELTGFGDIDAIFLATRTLPEKNQVDWMLNVVDRLPIDNGKLLWWIVLAELYPNRPETRKIAERMRLLLTEEDRLSEWVNLAVVYRQAGDFEAARSLLEFLAKQAPSDARDISSRIKIAQEFAYIGQPKRALTELNQLNSAIAPGQLSTHPDWTHHLALAHAAINNLTAVSDLLQKLPDKADPDSFSFHAKDVTRSAIARQFAEQGNFQQSQKFLLSIKDSQLQGETAQRIVHHLLHKGQWRQAAAISAFVEPKLQALIAYKAAQANQTAISDRIVAAMRGQDMDITLLLQTTYVLNQVGYYTKSRPLLKEALAFVTEQKIQPLRYKVAVQFADAGELEQANQLLDEQARNFEELSRSQKTSLSMFDPLLLDAPNPDESALWRFFEHVRLKAPDFKPTQRNSSKIEAVPVQRSREGSIVMNLGSLATFYSRARNFAKADQFLQRIPDQYCDFKASILEFVVSEASAAKQPDEAQKLLTKYSRPTNTMRKSLIAIANLYLDQKQTAKAIALLEQALNLKSS
ncbi:hypothetical protein [Leptolyngbya sp. UWPOB_LEPTO1]|uniref:tetratricopeptide repeat protein n=1 Tax=Leptolyngbya sp. UWPOB_LEPTO1 TaxID=2815653 RepID=UPI00257E4EB9|nr:hypothetical protein [Leptolyngbya sp. UWPOB_LEPTO1]